MQNETYRGARQPNSAPSITVPPRQRFGVLGALKAVIIMAVLFALLGVEVTLRIAPQLGVVGNAAIIWLVWACLRPGAGVAVTKAAVSL